MGAGADGRGLLWSVRLIHMREEWGDAARPPEDAIMSRDRGFA
jgi:hypothetical protein